MSIQPISSSAASIRTAPDLQATRNRPAATEHGSAGAAQGVGAPSASARTTGVDGAERVPSAEALQKALEDVAKAVAPMAQGLEFSLDKDSGKTVVKVMDTETNEVIRQIPSEEVLAISKAIDKLKGLLIKQQA